MGRSHGLVYPPPPFLALLSPPKCKLVCSHKHIYKHVVYLNTHTHSMLKPIKETSSSLTHQCVVCGSFCPVVLKSFPGPKWPGHSTFSSLWAAWPCLMASTACRGQKRVCVGSCVDSIRRDSSLALLLRKGKERKGGGAGGCGCHSLRAWASHLWTVES